MICLDFSPPPLKTKPWNQEKMPAHGFTWCCVDMVHQRQRGREEEGATGTIRQLWDGSPCTLYSLLQLLVVLIFITVSVT
jgi:hypothetical protein